MELKILLVTQYFWPESFIINDLVKRLSDNGHLVKVLTGKPNYPDGEIFSGYESDGLKNEFFVNQVAVHRAPLRERKSGGAKNLVLNYLSFIYNGLKFFPGLVRKGEFDVIFVFAPSPILSAIPAIYLKWKIKAHLVIWIQDLWPDSLSATGFVKNKFALGLVGVVVRMIYSAADTLLVQSKAFFDPVRKYAASRKIVYFPNTSVDMQALDCAEALPASVLKVLDENSCFVFAGNLGVAQSVATLVEAAERLREHSNIKIVLVGSGSMQAWIEGQLVERDLDNLILVGRFPSSIMPEFFNRATALLVTLKDEAIFSQTIPSKVQAYLSAGRPIIAALNGEGAAVINDAQAGLTCPAEDSEMLANNILALSRMTPDARARLGRSGREYFLDNFEVNSQSRKLVGILSQRIANK